MDVLAHFAVGAFSESAENRLADEKRQKMKKGVINVCMEIPGIQVGVCVFLP